MGKRWSQTQQRSLALQAAHELLRMVDEVPEFVCADEALFMLDALSMTQPQSVAFRWWEAASERQIDLFVEEWERWKAAERALCPICRRSRENLDFLLCCACSALFEGEGWCVEVRKAGR